MPPTISHQATASPQMQAKKASIHKELKGSIKYTEHHHEADGGGDDHGDAQEV